MSRGRIITRPDGKKFHVGGRKVSRSKGPRLSLKNYLDHSILTPVSDVDYSSTAQGLTDVLANDALGDCTCAGAFHALETILGAAGTPTAFTADQAIKLYELACGYKPSDPSTDQGGDEQSVLNFLAEKGFDGNGLHRILGSLAVDACNKLEVRWAVFNLCNLYYGVGLPDAYINPFPSGNGFVWGPGTPDPNNGHCFVAYGINQQGTLIDTWGEFGVFTYDAQATLASSAGGGETHAIVTKDLIMSASQKTPQGFAFQDLLSDLAKIGAITS